MEGKANLSFLISCGYDRGALESVRYASHKVVGTLDDTLVASEIFEHVILCAAVSGEQLLEMD
jgi:hypothetical protein